MESRRVKPYKALSQNFLIDKNISDKIVKLSGIDKTCNVLEIGPGLGALTVPLAEKADHVTAVEVDLRMIPELKNIITKYQNVTIVNADILNINICGLFDDKKTSESLHVCANLPYKITTPVITKLIETDMFSTITVMVQKEVAERMCAKPGTPEYGAFTVYVSYHTIPEILFDVPPECFTPRPKVTSSVVKMTVIKEHRLNIKDEKSFFRVVRAAFGQRRKTLINALYAVFERTHSKEDIIKAIESCGFDTKIRGERLSIDDFIKLSKEMKYNI